MRSWYLLILFSIYAASVPANVDAVTSKTLHVVCRIDPSEELDVPAGVRPQGKEGWRGMERKVKIGDVINIVIIEPEMSRKMTRVAGDGSFYLPKIGNIRADDMTLHQIWEEIVGKLSKIYMREPLVSVSIKEPVER